MIPTPPQSSFERPVAVYDTECYRNFWCLRFRSKLGQDFGFWLYEGQTFDYETKVRIARAFELFTTVSFNGNYYDVPMICAAMQGYDPHQLKTLNDSIIVGGLKPWELRLPEWKPADHIDVMEVAPGAGGQKQYVGRIHYKRMQDLPYDPGTELTPEQIPVVYDYCGNDLGGLMAIYDELQPHLEQRAALSKKYGIDLRSKSDAQVAEAVIKHRCEQELGRRIYKQDVDYGMRFKYEPPAYLSFTMPQLTQAFEIAKTADFRLSPNGSVVLPPELEGLLIKINETTYKIGIGGLHSQEKGAVHLSDDENDLFDIDAAAFYPSLMLNAGAWPSALGESFVREFGDIVASRLEAKSEQARLKALGDTSSSEYLKAKVGNGGGKIMINGTFGKTGSVYSILFAPKMLIQTTLTGQLSLLMLIEWLETYNIPVVSANTDGVLVRCHKAKKYILDALIAEWEKRSSLTMEFTPYRAIYSRDVNNYIAIKPDGGTKRKGEYALAGLDEKKNPNVEICSDAVAAFLAKGTPITETILTCTDIRKFVTIKKVNGGGVKMWGHGPSKTALVRDMIPTLEANGWEKVGRKWRKGDNFNYQILAPREAYVTCFEPQTPEYLGKVVRWYYGNNSPGSIVYASNGNTVGNSDGACPCMTLPDEFPDNINFEWYFNTAEDMLKDLGYYTLK